MSFDGSAYTYEFDAYEDSEEEDGEEKDAGEDEDPCPQQPTIDPLLCKARPALDRAPTFPEEWSWACGSRMRHRLASAHESVCHPHW